MDEEIRSFEAEFDEEVKEIFIIIEEAASAAHSNGDYMWKAYLAIAAFVGDAEGELHKEKRRLVWLMTEEDIKTREKVFGFEKGKIYRIKVRESLSYVNPHTGKNVKKGARLLVKGVVERDCSEKRLKALK